MKSSTGHTGLRKPAGQMSGPGQDLGNRYYNEGKEAMYVLR